MKKVDELPVVFLICAGRTGAGFMHSLLDSHEEILMIPAELKFYEMWERLSCEKIADPEKMVEVWCSRSKLIRLKEGVTYGYEEGKNIFTNCDFDLFRSSFKARLQERGLARPEVFLAIHQAYADSTRQDMRKVKLIIEFSGYPSCLNQRLEDFTTSRFLHSVRDYRGNYASLKQDYLNTRGGLFDWKGQGMIQKVPFAYLLDLVLRGTGEISRLQKKIGAERFYSVRLEDLHTALESTMRNVAIWLGITFRSLLLESTLGGRPWLGNSAFGKPVKGVAPEVLTRWKRTLGASEIMLIEYLFEDYMRVYSYELLTKHSRLQRSRVLWKSLLPLQDEFSFQISRKRPAGRWFRALWNIGPQTIFFLRLMRAILQIPVRILYYPASRYYLGRLICKKYATTKKKQDVVNNVTAIRGKKVFLRAPTELDVYGKWWQWFNDAEVSRYMNKGQEKNTVEKQLVFYRKIKTSESDFVACICDVDTKKHIGTTGIHNIRKRGGKKIGNFGIIIGEKGYWRKGIGSEAWSLMTEYAFDILGLDWIETKIFVDNAASLRIARKLGFEKVALLKNDIIKNHKENDRLLLRLEKNNWHQKIAVKHEEEN